jgi:hypothetical protein
MSARALTINSATAVRTINKGLCIARTSTAADPPEAHFASGAYRGSDEPMVNTGLTTCASAETTTRPLRSLATP